MKDGMHEAADYAIRFRAQEAKRLRARLGTVARRIKVGDYVNHHGFLGIVTRKHAFGFAFETLEGGKPNGESFFFYYSFWKSEPEPRTCWTTEL